MFEVNVAGLMRLSRAVARVMIRQKSGRFVHISSVSATLGSAYASVYAASKAAVLGFSRSLARELGKLGITSNAVCPWHVRTEMVEASMARRAKLVGKTAENYIDEIAKQSPLGRFVDADEVAAVVMLLLSQWGQAVNGQAINVCGGAALQA